MSIAMQINPFEFFVDADGDALDAGHIWIGESNKDPRNYPVLAYYDSALTIPASMPLRTSNGYVYRSGTPTFLYISGNYSVMVLDKTLRQVYYVPDFLLIGSQSAVSREELAAPGGAALVGGGLVTVADMAVLLVQARGTNQVFDMVGYHPGLPFGGGQYRWDSTVPRSSHDGGAIISPTVPWSGAIATLAAFIAGTGDTDPGAYGCFVRVSKKYRLTMWGAIPGTAVANAVTANDAAGNGAIDGCSALSVGGNIVELQIDDDMTFLCGATFIGTNKAIWQPKSNVRITGSGTIQIQNGANALAGATGWNMIYPGENTDGAVTNFEVIGVNFDGNGFNNLNTTMRRNALIGVLSGSDIKVSGCTFTNCPGFHVITIGKDIFPQVVTKVYLTDNDVINVAEAITGNVGITDHSSFYMLSTDSHSDNNRFSTSVASQVATCIEMHGSDSTANGNFYTGYLNLVNVGGYITNASNLRIADNIGTFVQMLVRAYSKALFVTDNLVICNNQLTVSTTSLCQIDFGGAQVENLLFGSVTIQDNVLRYVGADTIFPPPGIWLRGVKKAVVKGNTLRENFGWSVLISDAAIDAVIDVTDNVFDNPNRTATLSFASAIYIDAITNAFKLLNVSRNTFRAARQYALQAAGNAVGNVIKFTDNTVTETSDLVSVPSTSTVVRVDIQHYGDVPGAGQFSTGYTKFSMGSTIVDSANNQTWTIKLAPSNGLFNSEVYGVAAPVGGQHYQGDIVHINAPVAAGSIGVVCTTTGIPGTWKTFGAIQA